MDSHFKFKLESDAYEACFAHGFSARSCDGNHVSSSD